MLPQREYVSHQFTLGCRSCTGGKVFFGGFSEVNIFCCKNKLGKKQPLLGDDSLKDFEEMVLFFVFLIVFTVFKWSYLILTSSGSCRLQPPSLNHIILLFVGGTTLWPYGGGMVLLPGRVRCFVNNEHSTGLRMVPEMLRKGLRLKDFQRCLLLFLSGRKGACGHEMPQVIQVSCVRTMT